MDSVLLMVSLTISKVMPIKWRQTHRPRTWLAIRVTAAIPAKLELRKSLRCLDSQGRFPQLIVAPVVNTEASAVLMAQLSAHANGAGGEVPD